MIHALVCPQLLESILLFAYHFYFNWLTLFLLQDIFERELSISTNMENQYRLPKQKINMKIIASLHKI